MQSRTLFAMLILLYATAVLSAKKKPITYNEASYGTANQGTTLVVTFDQGKSYNHPLYAIWLADEQGKYIQTLYVSQSVGKGVYQRSVQTNRMWQPGEIKRPATLPYWMHQRNVTNENGTLLPTPKNPVADAYTGATVKNSFKLTLTTEQVLKGKFSLYFEINQSWDWNEYWSNDKFEGDIEYKTSSQPALVYKVTFDSADTNKELALKAVGHSHYAGANGSLTTDLSTLSTALDIAKKITVTVIRK